MNPFLAATAFAPTLNVPAGAGHDPGDFAALLQARGLYPQPTAVPRRGGGQPTNLPPQTQATTILAFKFSEGVLVAGDRRATAGNTVVYDRADKVLEIDSHSVMAIAGVPATAWEMARVLEHSFQYYRRTQLQEMSVGRQGARASRNCCATILAWSCRASAWWCRCLRPTNPARRARESYIFTT